jgi:hypothetical protein
VVATAWWQLVQPYWGLSLSDALRKESKLFYYRDVLGNTMWRDYRINFSTYLIQQYYVTWLPNQLSSATLCQNQPTTLSTLMERIHRSENYHQWMSRHFDWSQSMGTQERHHCSLWDSVKLRHSESEVKAPTWSGTRRSSAPFLRRLLIHPVTETHVASWQSSCWQAQAQWLKLNLHLKLKLCSQFCSSSTQRQVNYAVVIV